MENDNSINEELLSDGEKDFYSNCSEISRNSDSSDKEKSGNKTKLKTCLYFLNYGYCKFGSNCKYKHSKRANVNVKHGKNNERSSQNPYKHKQLGNENIKRNSDKQSSVKQNCRYYKMGACKKGENCEFIHPINSVNKEMDSLNISAHSQSIQKKIFSNTRPSKNRSTPLCYYFKKGMCYNGDKCKYYHQKKTILNYSENICKSDETSISKNSSEPNISEIPVNVPKDTAIKKNVTVFSRTNLNIHNLSSLSSEVASQLRCTEINQLKKRFPHLEVINENQTFSVIFEPSDPDWAFDLKKLKLEVDFPEKYPAEECKITVLHNADNIPHLLIKHLNKAIFDWIHCKFEENVASNKTDLIFRPFLKWFDKNVEDLFIAGLRKVKQDLKAKQDGIEFVPAENLFPASEKNDTENSSEENNVEEKDAENQKENTIIQICEIKLPEQANKSDQQKKPSYYPSNNGMKIIFSELELLEGAAAFICTKISVTLQCSRCKTSFNMKSIPKKSNSHACSKCSKNVGFTFEPSTVHQFSSVLGILHLLDCIAVDINLVECHFLVDCLKCSKQVPVDGIHYGHKHKMWCTYCSEKMLMSVGSVKFQAMKLTVSVIKYLPAKKTEKKSKDPVIKEGEPLPDFGACKHYKKSFRWLRFPCCGRLYPCDECHNEKETDHEMKYASRMVCGFCSKEQPYSREKPCTLCSQNMTKKSGSHWEGGKGCRNRIQMSREDKQKYAGIAKTVSRKAAQTNKPKKKH